MKKDWEKYLNTISNYERNKLIIATKFGEHWNFTTNRPYIDQSYDSLKESLAKNLKFLKKIDLLYLHKATNEALKSPDVKKAFEIARSKGIKNFGVSVSDIKTAEYVCDQNFYSFIQLPYNIINNKFDKIINLAKKKGKTIVINRPFNMGSLLYKNTDKYEIAVNAYKFILRKKFNGFVLTGTKSITHLKKNYEAFIRAQHLLLNEK